MTWKGVTKVWPAQLYAFLCKGESVIAPKYKLPGEGESLGRLIMSVQHLICVKQRARGIIRRLLNDGGAVSLIPMTLRGGGSSSSMTCGVSQCVPLSSFAAKHPVLC